MVIPAGIDILQPCKPDIPGPDIGPSFTAARIVPLACIFPAHFGTRIDESRLLSVEAGQNRKRKSRIDAQKKKTLGSGMEQLWDTWESREGLCLRIRQVSQ